MSTNVPKSNTIRVLGVAVFFGLTLFFLLVIVYSSRQSRATLNQTLHLIDREQQTRNFILLIRQYTIAAETAERGFLITGEEQYLEPYESALSLRAQRMASLEEYAQDIPEIGEILPDLESLIQARDGELEAAIALRRANNFDETVQAVRDGMQRNLSDQIRMLLQRMEDILNEKLKQSDENYRRQANGLSYIMSLAAYLSLFLGFLGMLFLVRHLRDQIRHVQLERDKEEAVRLAQEKSRFLASMNHEIRTPLNAILGFCELLENEVQTDRGRRYLSTVRTSGQALADLINDILDLSKIESGMLDLFPGPVHVRDFTRGIHNLFEEQARAAGLDFQFTVATECPEVIVFDPIRVRQILLNFLSNALKFTHRGAIRGSVWIRAFQKGSCDVVFSVQDTGRGIAPEKMRLIFQPFCQAEPSDETLGGTGLGLSICHELALLMGGEIEVTSEVGSGTEFLLILKRAKIVEIAGAPPPEPPAEVDFNQFPPLRIHVVDDNAFNIDLIAEFFEASHHRLDVSRNGLEALESMRRSKPDLVFMDIRMPVMGGDEAFLAMQQDPLLAAVPVIAVTASALDDQAHLKALFDGYLRKPFSRAEVYQTIQEILKRYHEALPRRTGKSVDRVDEIRAASARKDDGLSGQEREDRQALIRELSTLHNERWRQLYRAMLLSDVASVADELAELAKRHQVKELAVYAADLHRATEQIDQVRIEAILNQFDDLLENLS